MENNRCQQWGEMDIDIICHYGMNEGIKLQINVIEDRIKKYTRKNGHLIFLINMQKQFNRTGQFFSTNVAANNWSSTLKNTPQPKPFI